MQTVLHDLAAESGHPRTGGYSLLDHLKAAAAQGLVECGMSSHGASGSDGSGEAAGEDQAQDEAADRVAPEDAHAAPDAAPHGTAWLHDGHDLAYGRASEAPPTLLGLATDLVGRRDSMAACSGGLGDESRREPVGATCIHLIPSPPSTPTRASGSSVLETVGSLAVAGGRPPSWCGSIKFGRVQGSVGADDGDGFSGAVVADHVRVQEKTALLSHIAGRDRRICELEAALHSQTQQQAELSLLRQARAHLNLVSRAADVRARSLVEVARRAWFKHISVLGKALKRLQAACAARRRLARAMLDMAAHRRLALVLPVLRQWASKSARRRLVAVFKSTCLWRPCRSLDRLSSDCAFAPFNLAAVVLAALSRSPCPRRLSLFWLELHLSGSASCRRRRWVAAYLSVWCRIAACERRWRLVVVRAHRCIARRVCFAVMRSLAALCAVSRRVKAMAERIRRARTCRVLLELEWLLLEVRRRHETTHF